MFEVSIEGSALLELIASQVINEGMSKTAQRRNDAVQSVTATRSTITQCLSAPTLTAKFAWPTQLALAPTNMGTFSETDIGGKCEHRVVKGVAHVDPQDTQELGRMYQKPKLLNHSPVYKDLAGLNIPSNSVVVPHVIIAQLCIKFV